MQLLAYSPRVRYIVGSSPGRAKPKTIKLVCCFSAKHASLSSNNKDWLARNQNNVSVWSDMPTRGLLFQWGNTIKIQLNLLVLRTSSSSSSHWQCTCSRHDIADKMLNWRKPTITHPLTHFIDVLVRAFLMLFCFITVLTDYYYRLLTTWCCFFVKTFLSFSIMIESNFCF